MNPLGAIVSAGHLMVAVHQQVVQRLQLIRERRHIGEHHLLGCVVVVSAGGCHVENGNVEELLHVTHLADAGGRIQLES